jgi:hypothetical protein
MIFVCENPRAENIMMFEFADCGQNYLGRPSWFPITGKNEFVTELDTYTHFISCG